MKTSNKMTAKTVNHVNKVHKNTFKVLPPKKGKAIAPKKGQTGGKMKKSMFGRKTMC
jgi:hypothetical protein